MKKKKDAKFALFEVKNKNENEETSNDNFQSITSCIKDIKDGRGLSVTKIAEVVNQILNITNIDGTVINQLLIDAEAQNVNMDLIDGIPSRYKPTEYGYQYCEEMNQRSYIFYLWRTNFVLNLLNINLEQDIDDKSIEKIESKLSEYYIDVILNPDVVRKNIQDFKKQISKRR